MNSIKEGWFNEGSELWPGLSLSMEITKILHQERSQYQDIMVLETKSCGKALILDGIIQCTEFDECAYQEMIAFLPLYSHRNPQKVLIVGGGDGGVAREVAKHPLIKEVHVVEIDERVVELCKEYIPSMGKAYQSPLVTLHIEDGFKFMEKHQAEFDVIITDSSDPVGPAIPLYQKKYYELMKSALKPDGIVCSQVGSPWTNIDILKDTLKICKETFVKAAYAYACVPTYPTGQIGFVLGSLNPNTDFKNPTTALTREAIKLNNLRYYNTNIHKAAFSLANFVQDAVDDVLIPKAK